MDPYCGWGDMMMWATGFSCLGILFWEAEVSWGRMLLWRVFSYCCTTHRNTNFQWNTTTRCGVDKIVEKSEGGVISPISCVVPTNFYIHRSHYLSHLLPSRV